MTQPLLYIRNGYALYLGPLSENRDHRHHMLQVMISGEDDFTLHLQQKNISLREAIIDADVSHSIDTGGGELCLLLLDPEGAAAEGIIPALKGEEWGPLEEPGILSSFRSVMEGAAGMVSGEEMDALVEKLFRDAVESIIPARDEVMENLLVFLKSVEGKRCSAAEAAAVMGLSQSRMLHRFTEYTGIPFRRYLLWLRLRDAIDCITGGMNFTEAAHEAGFSDSAHLSRTFADTFGMTLLNIFKNYDVSMFIQVIT